MRYLANVASIHVLPGQCTGCGVCLDVCPHGVLGMREGKVEITDRDLCMECGACVTNCAFGALGVDKGVGCASALIKSMITGGEPTCGCETGGDAGGCC